MNYICPFCKNELKYNVSNNKFFCHRVYLDNAAENHEVYVYISNFDKNKISYSFFYESYDLIVFKNRVFINTYLNESVLFRYNEKKVAVNKTFDFPSSKDELLSIINKIIKLGILI